MTTTTNANSSISSSLGSGKILHRQAKEIVNNVYQHFKLDGGHKTHVIGRVSDITKVSKRSVERIVSEYKKIERGEVSAFKTPSRKRNRKSIQTELDGFDKCVIRRTLHNYNTANNIQPTIKKLHEKLKGDINFKGSVTILRQIVLNLGFRWKKIGENCHNLVERQDIRAARITYLKDVEKFRKSKRPLVFMDELCIHSSHSWPDENAGPEAIAEKRSKLAKIKGQTLVVVHAGCESGFIPNAMMVYKAGKMMTNFHEDTFFHVAYEKWLTEQLIPNLPQECVLVIENSQYNNTEVDSDINPASNSKQDMQAWLKRHNIEYSEDMYKPELYGLIKQNKPPTKEYILDNLLAKYGHTVLRLPSDHPDLSPIKYIWALVKDHVADKNVTYRINDVMHLAQEKISSISGVEWSARYRHVKAVEQTYLANETILDNTSELSINSFYDDLDSNHDDDSEDDNSVSSMSVDESESD